MSDGDDSLIVRIALSVAVLWGSALTSIGTAGVSGVVGLAALGAIWGMDLGPADGGGGGS